MSLDNGARLGAFSIRRSVSCQPPCSSCGLSESRLLVMLAAGVDGRCLWSAGGLRNSVGELDRNSHW